MKLFGTLSFDPAVSASGWCLCLTPETTVVQLAHLMGRLHCEVVAEHVGGGTFRVTPRLPESRPPTDEEIYRILCAEADGDLGTIRGLRLVPAAR